MQKFLVSSYLPVLQLASLTVVLTVLAPAARAEPGVLAIALNTSVCAGVKRPRRRARRRQVLIQRLLECGFDLRQGGLCWFKALSGCEAHPLEGLGQGLLDSTVAVKIFHADVELRLGKPSLRGFPVSPHRLLVVLSHALPIRKQNASVILSLGNPLALQLSCATASPPCSFERHPGHAHA